ncbi:phosphoribosylformylglycinamidine synthase [Lacrimispora sp.]|uniref:phosphoribosylformylglycinamidine synthase n=1 Tax=Lacrimispora sp. TaxID=2719234 RepID=UPI00285C4A25|nr:phosphoribosylformylglycinamidine synthase [Lacrimispora sp.]MDR7813094.1 phosphoribosylformylglycinamidine synthase [Lacrimispora sp.]
MSVRRVYVEKKTAYAVKAMELREEIAGYLGINTVTGVRVLIRYDVEALSDEVYGLALTAVFSEPPVDEVYEEAFPKEEGDVFFTVEYLPGQFDQRADSAEQCVKLLKEDEEPVIRSATTYVISGVLTDVQIADIKSYCINPVDSREAEERKPETLAAMFDTPLDVIMFDGFTDLAEDALMELYESLNLAMTFKDFLHIRNYYKEEEQRDPSMTEIRVLDTYWSDHCRHTTFQTELRDVTFRSGDYRKPIEDTYRQYLADREVVLKGKDGKFVCLMDLALLAMKKLRMEGKVEDLEVSDEINACSIVVPVLIDGVEEEWLVNFKNETHNHPTEIEPFGGAATCLGGAIRDPLSGRTYVYQAMRVTGAADPTKPLSETLKGKLPQRKIVTGAADGYSSYGNQIGLATGYVKEIYHPDYVAKRMEIGAVIGAAPRKNVIRETSDPGDLIILLGGRTGRDGCGGATGSSKVHTEASIETCGAEVQKGNAPTERKIQRLFRREEVSRLIKKCNDFGAGGVSVAIGELADGLLIDLDKVPKKYAGLDGTEIAISESQERMAVVVDPKDADRFLAYAAEENLEAVVVAEVRSEPRLVMNWRGKTIVDISRAFLDTNGAHQEASVVVEVPDREPGAFMRQEIADVREAWLKLLSDLNVCSQKGLVEMFDGSIGAGSVFMPYGGRYQLTETQTMVAKLPVLHGKTDTVTMMSCGFDPYLSNWSPYHGAVYAVLSSVAKIVASGGDYRRIRFTFQEYFRRMTDDPARWSQPFSALLGAYSAQIGFGLPSIGGKDSMSGTFRDIDVPPTLVSFAVDVAEGKHVITPEFKKAGSNIVVFRIEKDSYDLPVYSQVMKGYEALFEDTCAGRILSAYAVESHGICEAVSKMAFGNRMGIRISNNVDPGEFFKAGWGDVICEVPEERLEELTVSYTVIGEVTDGGVFEYGGTAIAIDEALNAWTKPLEDVFPTVSGAEKTPVSERLYDTKDIYVCRNKVAKPSVFIPVFPGTNCEYDSERAFNRAGANVVTKVFRNLTAQDIRESVEVYRREISKAQIVMFPGGFSAGDEPDGSAKFFANLFRNQVIKEEIGKLLNERDGLMLGICNGFQALIKLGLVPEGMITEQREDSPTLAMNTIGRHVSKMVYTKVVTNKSPWLSGAELGGVYCNPASHGEGRFVAGEEWIKRLFDNGQVATQYVDDKGCPTMDECWNPNGSFMAVEGITSPDGRILGKMAHSERRGESVAMNIYGEQDMKIFESGVKYFQ